MTGYCKYCDSIIPDEEIIRAFNAEHRMVWTGCLSCYEKRNELKNLDQKQI